MAIAFYRDCSLLLTTSVSFIGLGLLCYWALLIGFWLIWIPAFLSGLTSFVGVGLSRLRLEERT